MQGSGVLISLLPAEAHTGTAARHVPGTPQRVDTASHRGAPQQGLVILELDP